MIFNYYQILMHVHVYILEKLVKLELETTNTFKKVKLIFEEYKAWKANIESKFY